MKIHEFGLWFFQDGEWFTTFPQGQLLAVVSVYYDGECLGRQWPDYELSLFGIFDNLPHIMKLKIKLELKKGCRHTYLFDRLLTMDDFDIVENPDYRGKK